MKTKLFIAVVILVIALLTPIYLDRGGFYFDDQGLSIENFRFRTPTKQAFRIVNDSSRKGDIVIWFRHDGENVCLWVFQMFQETHNDLTTHCEGLNGKDFHINYEWAASNPRLASEAERIGFVQFF